MPTYIYRCEKCDNIVEYFHSYRVKKTTCEKCGEETLKKMLNTPINIKKSLQHHPSKTGEVVQKTIQDTKEEMEKDKQRLKRRKR